ncbi:GAF domain-containing protein [Deinococcus deserti]|uniref:Putative signal transduction protein: sensor, GAF domain protein n=1 Tax=Deinococcus deserti (strain DSM 17065 / CIP 109153 / LMG 22923 / VCD115) TaxID=546414 RepID=C1D0Q2_DEIDV|nr:GAF domain-containing protein [Deinococcus deserti]ACO45426.1 putative signal transduction protein : sensor, GAF domain protein [Deinococcus deserti VCD115]
MLSRKSNPTVHEEQRVSMLRSLNIMDTPKERSFDLIAEGLVQLYAVPMALVNFMDGTRQFCKASVGLELQSMPVTQSLCRYALAADDVLIIPDTRLDARSASHPFVIGQPELRFYAGVPIMTEGFRIGTVCILDTQPHAAGEFDLSALTYFAGMVAVTLQARKKNSRSGVDYPPYRVWRTRAEFN